MSDPTAKERLIVALDYSNAADALGLAAKLGERVSFFKVGWELFIAGVWREVIRELPEKEFFVDLKIPGDIDNTVTRLVRVCVDELSCVKFLTLSESVKVTTIRTAVQARGDVEAPKFLVVPLFSSLGAADFEETHGLPAAEMDNFILRRADEKLSAGCDGVIASGPQIGLLRKAHRSAIIVSPGIRPLGASSDDHARLTTPAEAIELGSDYLVVGRPIRNAPDPADAAERIIEEMDGAFRRRAGQSSA